MKKVLLISAGTLAIVALMMIPVGGSIGKEPEMSNSKVETMDLSSFSQERPEKKMRLLFIHHSCGGQLLADLGKDDGNACIYNSHPNGGGLRRLLEANDYEVHEASYSSEIGENTDIFDWLPKFRNKMNKILTCDNQDVFYKDGRKNDIIVFKSCFPNNLFLGKGTAPGNPNGPERTVWNAKAAYAALLEEFGKHPSTLFVAVTAPPMSNVIPAEPLWKVILRQLLNKTYPDVTKSGPLAREFNNWLKANDGWLEGYEGHNVAVFDYYDILTGNGRSNFTAYPTGDQGQDSHPSMDGNAEAAKQFIPFLNAVVRRASLSE